MTNTDELSHGWEWRTINQIIELVQNGTTSPQNQEGVGYPVSRIQTIQDNNIDPTRVRHISDEDAAQKYFYQYGDILYSHINSFELVGKVALYKGNPPFLVHGMNLLRLRTKKEKCLPNYLYFYLRSSIARRFTEPFIKRAIGQASINQTNLKQVKIPLPYPDELERSVAEQRRIVVRIEVLLAELLEMRKLQEEISADCNKLMDALLTETFTPEELAGWRNKAPLGELAEITARQVNPTLPEYRNKPHIYGATIEEGTGRLLEYNTAAEDGMTSGKYHFRTGAVLYSKIRPYLRKVTIVDFEGLCSADMYPLHPKTDDLLPEFLMWSLLSPTFTNYANSLSGRARIPKLNRTQLFSYEMPYPAKDIQERICERLKHTREEIGEMQKLNDSEIQYIDQLEQAILSQAFRGEL